MTRYFFDITGVLEYLRHHRRFSGIQRVVVTLADAACRKLPSEKAFLSYFDNDRGAYVAIPHCTLDAGCLTDPDLLRAAFKIQPPRVNPQEMDLRKYERSPLRAAFHAFRFHLYKWLGREKYRQRDKLLPKGVLVPEVRKISVADHVAFDSVAISGDHLVVMDAVWGMTKVLAVFRSSKDRGILVHSMLHDLIPVVRPEVTNDAILQEFEPWLQRSYEYTTSYLATSRSTGSDLSNFLTRQNISLPVQITPLAQAALPSSPRHTRSSANETAMSALAGPALISERIRALLTHPYVLCVGTLEVRKNNWKIAQAWDRLRLQEGLNLPRLVFAGQKGWMNHSFDRMMEATGHLSGWVEVIEKPSDAELEVLYKNCLFTITASYYEGWGLPIGESLAYGKTAVVSDTSSMPEVGGHLVEYCDPNSIDSIYRACHRLILDVDRRAAFEAKIASTPLRQWDDVVNDLLSALAATEVPKSLV